MHLLWKEQTASIQLRSSKHAMLRYQMSISFRDPTNQFARVTVPNIFIHPNTKLK